MMNERYFPENFIWGTATASYQVEGGAHEDGKGPSVWTEFEKQPGAILDNVMRIQTGSAWLFVLISSRIASSAVRLSGAGRGRFFPICFLPAGRFRD